MRYLLPIAALIASAACADSTAPASLRAPAASHDQEINQTDPSALVTTNPCNNDVVALTGTLHTLLHTTDAGSGNTHFYIDFTSNYSGVGAPSGVNYEGGTRTLNDFTSNNPYPIVTDFYQDISLRSQTGVDNYSLTIHVKMTINANGVPTADVEDFSERCSG